MSSPLLAVWHRTGSLLLLLPLTTGMQTQAYSQTNTLPTYRFHSCASDLVQQRSVRG